MWTSGEFKSGQHCTEPVGRTIRILNWTHSAVLRDVTHSLLAGGGGAQYAHGSLDYIASLGVV
jgi:hypothetical protein